MPSSRSGQVDFATGSFIVVQRGRRDVGKVLASDASRVRVEYADVSQRTGWLDKTKVTSNTTEAEFSEERATAQAKAKKEEEAKKAEAKKAEEAKRRAEEEARNREQVVKD